MASDREQNRDSKEKGKKKLALLTGLAVVALIIISVVGFYVLGRVKKSDLAAANTPNPSATQEQFAGQAETSQQLQTECQNSANAIAKGENLQASVDEFKKHVDNCREVYFTGEEKTEFRSEGMYPDLSVDLITKIASANKPQAVEFLTYLKKLPAWQFYMGPIVCDSQAVLAAYEETLNAAGEKVCVKAEEFNDKIYSELKNKNFSVLERTMASVQVAWLSSPETDIGCPEKISNIIKTVQSSISGSQIRPAAQKEESTLTSVAFGNGGDEDKVVLEFGDVKGCFQLKSALVSGITNE